MGFLNALPSFWHSLSNADKINFLIALSTAVAALTAAYSALLARRSIQGALDQFRAQTFMGVLSYEREVEFSKNMDVVRALNGKAAKDLTDGEQKSIRVVVDFLNHIAHLIRHRYAVPKEILLLYSPSISPCADNLLGDGQWLKELRKRTGEPRYYLHFAKLCQKETQKLLWENKEVDFTRDPYEPSLPRVH